MPEHNPAGVTSSLLKGRTRPSVLRVLWGRHPVGPVGFQEGFTSSPLAGPVEGVWVLWQMPKTVLFAGAHSQLGWSWLLSVLGAPGSGLPPISPSKSRRAITDLSLGHCRVGRSCHRFCLFLFSSLSKPNHPHHEDKPGIKPGRKRFSKKHVVLSSEGTWPTSKTFHTPQKPHTVNLFFCFPSLHRADN